jgi:hypothetical protein
MDAILQQRIMPNNGAGWYWEVVRPTGEVIARGVADTHAQARAEAGEVSPRDELTPGGRSCVSS